MIAEMVEEKIRKDLEQETEQKSTSNAARQMKKEKRSRNQQIHSLQKTHGALVMDYFETVDTVISGGEPVSNKTRVKCKLCNKEYATSSMSKHLKYSHANEIKVLKCEKCGKHETPSPYGLARHKAACIGRGFACAFCDNSFTSAMKLQQHTIEKHVILETTYVYSADMTYSTQSSEQQISIDLPCKCGENFSIKTEITFNATPLDDNALEMPSLEKMDAPGPSTPQLTSPPRLTPYQHYAELKTMRVEEVDEKSKPKKIRLS